MNCAKCGKKTENENLFCPDCLKEMERYPVKRGTPVHIPTRPEPTERKQTRSKKERTPEEQIAFLHKLVRWLLLLVTVLAVALTIATGILVYQMAEPEETQPQEAPRNRNYTTSVVTDEP